MEGKNNKKIGDAIEEALYSGDATKLADITKTLMEENEWLKSNEGLQKLIKTLENK